MLGRLEREEGSDETFLLRPLCAYKSPDTSGIRFKQFLTAENEICGPKDLTQPIYPSNTHVIFTLPKISVSHPGPPPPPHLVFWLLPVSPSCCSDKLNDY
jgi:hypothetical protein